MEKKILIAGFMTLFCAGAFAQFNSTDPEYTVPKGNYEFSATIDDFKNAFNPKLSNDSDLINLDKIIMPSEKNAENNNSEEKLDSEEKE